MWIVWDDQDGMMGIFDKYEESLAEYESCKANVRDCVQDDNEFSGDERVVLAKIEKQLYSYDTKNPVMVEGNDGKELPTADTYWDLKEDTY